LSVCLLEEVICFNTQNFELSFHVPLETCCTRVRGSMKVQDANNRQNSPSAHHRTTLSGYIFATARIDNRKKNLLNSTPTCPYNMLNFGPLAAEICWRVWGTPANFSGFPVLAALLHSTLVLCVSQTLRR